jgi:hypothetical protein
LDKIVYSDTYDVYIHNYSGETSINHEAQITVYKYKDNELDKTITLPETKKRYVKILEIRNREIKVINDAVDLIRQ